MQYGICQISLRSWVVTISNRIITSIYLPTFLPTYNLGQVFGIWNRIEKSGKTGHENKLWYLLLRIFKLLLSKFNFWMGDWTQGYVSTQIWDFANISLFPKILRLKPWGNSWGNTRYHVSFYLWLIGSVLKHCKVSKYYDQDCRLCLYFVKTYGHHSWQARKLRWRTPSNKVMWLFDHVIRW